MIGAIIGDIVGSRFEFNNNFDYDFELFHKDCSFTDDTICTIAIADAISRNISYKNALLEWCRKFPHPMGGYGGSFARWIHQENPEPYNSFGNGSAMRVSAVGWAFHNEGKALREAAKSAACTHNHPEGVKGAEAVAMAIFHGWRGQYVWRDTVYKGRLEAVKGVAESFYPNIWTDNFVRGAFDETCQGTVPVAFKIVLNSESFEDAIRNAIVWGGDSDTLGAIVGAIAEAVWTIPETFREKAYSYLTPEMKEVLFEYYSTDREKYGKK